MEKNHLTELLSNYKTGGTGKQLLIREISLFVYKYPFRSCRWHEDECSDFFCYFYPRIEKMIENFELKGIPFEVYLIKCIRMQLKTFAKRKRDKYINLCMIKNRVFWPCCSCGPSCDAAGCTCYEENIDYMPVSDKIKKISSSLEKSLLLNSGGAITNRTLKKRILMLTLKNITIMPSDQLTAMSKLLGCDIIWLENCRQDLKIKIDSRMSRKKTLSERRNRHFCRLFYYHEQLKYEPGDEDKKILAEKIKKTKKKISEFNRKLKNTSSSPTHRDVASIMKIPKGSVDSGLYYLKIYLENK